VWKLKDDAASVTKTTANTERKRGPWSFENHREPGQPRGKREIFGYSCASPDEAKNTAKAIT